MDSTNTYKERRTYTGVDPEDVCEEWLQGFDNLFYKRFGWGFEDNTIEMKHFYKLPYMMKKMPDFIVVNNIASFLEVKGYSKYLHLKTADYEQYKKWNTIMPLSFFVYNFKSKKHKIIDWHEMKNERIPMAEITNFEVDGKQIYKIYLGD